MKNKTKLLFLLLAVLWLPYCMGAFDKAKPAASTSLRVSNPEILANWSALETAIDKDHDFTTGGTQSGKHEVLTMQEEASAGASATNELHVQAIDGGSGQPELAVTSEDGNQVQMTKDGNLHSSTNLTVAGTSTMTGLITANGGVALGDGDNLTGSATSGIFINTDKFFTDGATGNTGCAGTFVPIGNVIPTSYADTNGGFLDEDDMSTDSATAVASQQSIKAYVDAQAIGAFGAWDVNDSLGSALDEGNTYLADIDGFFVGFVSGTVANNAAWNIKTDSSNPPTTKRYDVLHAGSEGGDAFKDSFNVPVKSGEYVKADTTVGTHTWTIYWIPVGTGDLVKQ
jgi:hypothetical protein